MRIFAPSVIKSFSAIASRLVTVLKSQKFVRALPVFRAKLSVSSRVLEKKALLERKSAIMS